MLFLFLILRKRTWRVPVSEIAVFGKTHTDEYKATRSALYKGKTAEEIMGAEAAAKRKIKASQTFTKKHSDPEYKLAQSKRMTEWWAKRKEQKKC